VDIGDGRCFGLPFRITVTRYPKPYSTFVSDSIWASFRTGALFLAFSTRLIRCMFNSIAGREAAALCGSNGLIGRLAKFSGASV
jgi:hypothetical protein